MKMVCQHCKCKFKLKYARQDLEGNTYCPNCQKVVIPAPKKKEGDK